MHNELQSRQFGFGRRPFGFGGFPLGFLGGLAAGALISQPYYPYGIIISVLSVLSVLSIWWLLI